MLKEQSEKDENKVQTTSDIESSEDNKEEAPLITSQNINNLDSNNINYDVQVRFKDCNEGRSSYDFKIYNKDSTFFLCEVQGEQHYKDILFLGGLEYNQSRDKIKRDYCEKKGIKLIEIPYYDIDNLDKYFK